MTADGGMWKGSVFHDLPLAVQHKARGLFGLLMMLPHHREEPQNRTHNR